MYSGNVHYLTGSNDSGFGSINSLSFLEITCRESFGQSDRNKIYELIVPETINPIVIPAIELCKLILYTIVKMAAIGIATNQMPNNPTTVDKRNRPCAPTNVHESVPNESTIFPMLSNGIKSVIMCCKVKSLVIHLGRFSPVISRQTEMKAEIKIPR